MDEKCLPSLLNAVDHSIRRQGEEDTSILQSTNFEGVKKSIDSYLIPFQLEELERIERISNAIEESNRERQEALATKRADIYSRLQRLQDAKDLSLASFHQMSKIGIPELEALIDRMHQK